MKPITPLLGNNGFGRGSVRSSTGAISSAQKYTKKPSDIYDLKIKNAKLDQEIKILKTQLSRTKDRIHQQSKMIAHTVGPKSNVSGLQNKRQSTINNLNHSVVSAQNTLDTLNQQLEQLEKDDRNCYVEELRTEILISYAEYMRIQDMLNESSTKNRNYSKTFAAVDKKASAPSIEDQEFELRALQEENAKLIDKIKAYQTKCERTKNESTILTREGDGESLECSIQEVQDANERRTKKLNWFNELSQKENEEYDATVAYLNSLINYQRSIIADHLQGKELPDPNDKPKYQGPQSSKENKEEEAEQKQDENETKQPENEENQENSGNNETEDKSPEDQPQEEQNNQSPEESQADKENEVITSVADDIVEDIQDTVVEADIQG